MLPKDPHSRARGRSFSRFSDLYLDPQMGALLPLLFGRKVDDAFVQQKLAGIGDRLDQLDNDRESVGSR